MLCSVIALAAACSSAPSLAPDTNAETLVSSAKAALQNDDFRFASTALEQLAATYPTSRYSVPAKLDLAYAYYGLEEFEKAVDISNLFLRQHPTSPLVPYAHYIKAISNFDRGKGMLDAYFPRQLSQIDQRMLAEAAQDFSILIERYPSSEYAVDAQKRYRFLVEQMAKHELDIAQYYLTRGSYTAAATRAQAMLEKYPQSALRERALQLIAEAQASSP